MVLRKTSLCPGPDDGGSATPGAVTRDAGIGLPSRLARALWLALVVALLAGLVAVRAGALVPDEETGPPPDPGLAEAQTKLAEAEAEVAELAAADPAATAQLDLAEQNLATEEAAAEAADRVTEAQQALAADQEPGDGGKDPAPEDPAARERALARAKADQAALAAQARLVEAQTQVAAGRARAVELDRTGEPEAAGELRAQVSAWEQEHYEAAAAAQVTVAAQQVLAARDRVARTLPGDPVRASLQDSVDAATGDPYRVEDARDQADGELDALRTDQSYLRAWQDASTASAALADARQRLLAAQTSLDPLRGAGVPPQVTQAAATEVDRRRAEADAAQEASTRADARALEALAQVEALAAERTVGQAEQHLADARAAAAAPVIDDVRARLGQDVSAAAAALDQARADKVVVVAEARLLTAQRRLEESTGPEGSRERQVLLDELEEAWRRYDWALHPPAPPPGLVVGVAIDGRDAGLGGVGLPPATGTSGAVTRTMAADALAVPIPTTPLPGGARRHVNTPGLNLPAEYAAYADSMRVYNRKERLVDLAFWADGAGGATGGAIAFGKSGPTALAGGAGGGLLAGETSAVVTALTTPLQWVVTNPRSSGSLEDAIFCQSGGGQDEIARCQPWTPDITIPMRDKDRFVDDLALRDAALQRLVTTGEWDAEGWGMIGRPVTYEPVGEGYRAAPGQRVPDYFLAPFPDARVEGIAGGQDLNIGQTLLNSGAGCGGGTVGLALGASNKATAAACAGVTVSQALRSSQASPVVTWSNPATGQRMQCVYAMEVVGAGKGLVHSTCSDQIQGLDAGQAAEVGLGAAGGEVIGWAGARTLSALGRVITRALEGRPLRVGEFRDPVTGEVWTTLNGRQFRVINGDLVEPDLTMPAGVRPGALGPGQFATGPGPDLPLDGRLAPRLRAAVNDLQPGNEAGWVDLRGTAPDAAPAPGQAGAMLADPGQLAGRIPAGWAPEETTAVALRTARGGKDFVVRMARLDGQGRQLLGADGRALFDEVVLSPEQAAQWLRRQPGYRGGPVVLLSDPTPSLARRFATALGQDVRTYQVAPGGRVTPFDVRAGGQASPDLARVPVRQAPDTALVPLEVGAGLGARGPGRPTVPLLGLQPTLDTILEPPQPVAGSLPGPAFAPAGAGSVPAVLPPMDPVPLETARSAAEARGAAGPRQVADGPAAPPARNEAREAALARLEQAAGATEGQAAFYQPGTTAGDPAVMADLDTLAGGVNGAVDTCFACTVAIEDRFRGRLDATAPADNARADVAAANGVPADQVDGLEQTRYLRERFAAGEPVTLAFDDVPAAMVAAGNGSRAAMALFKGSGANIRKHVVHLVNVNGVIYPLDASMAGTTRPATSPLVPGEVLRQGWDPDVHLTMLYAPNPAAPVGNGRGLGAAAELTAGGRPAGRPVPAPAPGAGLGGSAGAAQPVGFRAQPELFEAAYERATAPDAVVPYMRTDATGGLGSRDGGRSFGVELEFVLPRGWSAAKRRAVLDEIGEELSRSCTRPG
jgi:hypothetical protein